MTQNFPNWPKNDPKLPKWPKNDPKWPKNKHKLKKIAQIYLQHLQLFASLPSQHIYTYHVYFAKGVETVKATSPLTGFTGN